MNYVSIFPTAQPQQKEIVVGIADMQISDSGLPLITHALGSCIGISIHDPQSGVGALLHYMLPDSQMDPEKARKNPFQFADTGVTQMLRAFKELGAQKKNLIIKVAGGANIMDPRGIFDIGKRNFLALKKILWRYNIIIKGKDVGGAVGRNMKLNPVTGSVTIRMNGQKEEFKI